MKVCKIFEWDAAHKLKLPYSSACNQLHGHTYKVEIELEGPVDQNGMVIDFQNLKEIINSNESFDHKYLNKIVKQPTAENIVKYLGRKLVKEFNGMVRLSRVRVWESSTSYAEEVY